MKNIIPLEITPDVPDPLTAVPREMLGTYRSIEQASARIVGLLNLAKSKNVTMRNLELFFSTHEYHEWRAIKDGVVPSEPVWGALRVHIDELIERISNLLKLEQTDPHLVEITLRVLNRIETLIEKAVREK